MGIPRPARSSRPSADIVGGEQKADYIGLMMMAQACVCPPSSFSSIIFDQWYIYTTMQMQYQPEKAVNLWKNMVFTWLGYP
jgi:hypothetical protein